MQLLEQTLSTWLLTPAFNVKDGRFTYGHAILVLAAFALAMLTVYHLLKVKDHGRVCSARHILVRDLSEIKWAKLLLEGGKSFESVAKELSICQSSEIGGDLGIFGPGEMMIFDDICFNADTPVGEVLGPIQTSHGYHLLLIESRSGIPVEGKKQV